jgi:hypothetical protein
MKLGDTKLPRYSELISILTVTTNVFVGLAGRVMLIWRSFFLVLGFRYFSYFSYVLGIGWLGFFSDIYFRSFFITVIMSLFYGISNLQSQTRNFIRNLWNSFRSNYNIHVCYGVQYPTFWWITIPGNKFFFTKK